VAEARTSASEQVTSAAMMARSFSAEVAAYRAAPNLYTQRRVLEIYTRLDAVRKYLVVGDPGSVIIEYQTAQEGGLDRVISEGIEAEKKKGR
jgi:hypothetical protein